MSEVLIAALVVAVLAGEAAALWLVYLMHRFSLEAITELVVQSASERESLLNYAIEPQASVGTSLDEKTQVARHELKTPARERTLQEIDRQMAERGFETV